MVLFADFFAYADPDASRRPTRTDAAAADPLVRRTASFVPHVYGLSGKRDPKTFKRVYVSRPDANKCRFRLFAQGYRVQAVRLHPDQPPPDRRRGHGRPSRALFLLGTDLQGRDLWSRLMYGTRISLTIGLVGVVAEPLSGRAAGRHLGLYGGWVDTVIQRVIEILRSIPDDPALDGAGGGGAAATGREPHLLRHHDHHLADRLDGAGARGARALPRRCARRTSSWRPSWPAPSQMRIIFRHMVPSFLSHIIAATTLAMPAMIISETSLSFLGLGLRPPAITWGVLLQQAQNIQAVAISPWLLFPAVPVILAVLAFNFLGDGLRDAADPYG